MDECSNERVEIMCYVKIAGRASKDNLQALGNKAIVLLANVEMYGEDQYSKLSSI